MSWSTKLVFVLAVGHVPVTPEAAVRRFLNAHGEDVVEPVACAVRDDGAVCQHEGFYYLCYLHRGCGLGWSCVDMPGEFPQELLP